VAPRPEKHHAGRSLQDVKSEATGLYRSKNFSGAALAIKSALSAFSGDDVKDLQAIAAIYTQLGRDYSVGMAPGTRPVDAYQALLRANDYDREVGGAYAQELHDKLVAIAPRAATSYMAAKSFEQAFQAVRKAEELGSRTDDLKIVRQNLADKAKELLRTAHSELASDPEAAKQKLHQIQGMVDRQNPVWQQAAKLLNGP
jgi:tetratricopeptide (TPR) repeat protein